MLKFYLAITNNCNRACKFCSMYSRPGLKSFMSLDWIKVKFDAIDKPFEVQLEGGEPTIHPEYNDILRYFDLHPMCMTIIITTNGTTLPASYNELDVYFRSGPIITPLIFKVSVNEYLLSRDENLFAKCENLKMFFDPNFQQPFPLRRQENLKRFLDPDVMQTLILNVRLRRGVRNDDAWIVDELKKRELFGCSNVFYWQRYGFASDMEEYEPPFIVENPVDFHLYSPDCIDFGQDLIARSKHMKTLLGA